jgi:hypothetical protein
MSFFTDPIKLVLKKPIQPTLSQPPDGTPPLKNPDNILDIKTIKTDPTYKNSVRLELINKYNKPGTSTEDTSLLAFQKKLWGDGEYSLLNTFFNNVVTKMVILLVLLSLIVIGAIVWIAIRARKPSEAPSGSVPDKGKILSAINAHNAARGGATIKESDIVSVKEEGGAFTVVVKLGGSNVTYKVDGGYKTASVAV